VAPPDWLPSQRSPSVSDSGLLTLGKGNFQASEGFQHDRFFRDALLIGQGEVPGSAGLRQSSESHATRDQTAKLPQTIPNNTDLPA
jgi:hypothetical protein